MGYRDLPAIYWTRANNGHRVIAVDLSRTRHVQHFDDLVRGDWAAFDALVATLSVVKAAVLAFRTKEHRARFR